MKKFFVMALAAMSITLMSCSNGVEAKAQEFADKTVEIMKSGNMMKLTELAKEVEEYTNTLSEDDKKLFVEAMQRYTEAHKADYEQAAKEGIGNALGGLKEGLKIGK